MKKAVYAFSGDPITYGHLDIIIRAAKIFDQLIVAIGNNLEKKYLFTQAERLQMAKKSLQPYSNVKVLAFSGLLVDFAYEHNVDVIVKGVRSERDFAYEQNLDRLGSSQNLGIDTFLLFARANLAHVSSSAVKALQIDQGLIQDYVPPYVKQCLEAKLTKQYLLGITGEIAAGKSYLSERLLELGRQVQLAVHNIELDRLAEQIQTDLKQEKYAQVRQEIIATFGPSVALNNGAINRKALGEIVFADRKKLATLNQIMRTPILVRLRQELKKKQGLILINAALLAESDMLSLSNNNLVLLKVNEKEQLQRLQQRGLTTEQIQRRLRSQYNFQHKKKVIDQEISQSKQGKLWLFSSSGHGPAADPRQLFQQIRRYFNI